MSALEPNLAAKVMMDDLRAKWQEARKTLAEAKQREKDMHAEFLRLYHILERLPTFNAAEGYRIAKRFREVLVARRQAKWDIRDFERIVTFMDATQHKMLSAASWVDENAARNRRYVETGSLAELEEEVV